MSKNVKADGRCTSANSEPKKRKKRLERRKAKKDPEAQPTYGKYKGWVS